MALSIAGYDAALTTELNAFGYNGTKKAEFTLAVATGVVTTAQGLTGIISSPALSGPSTGTGITGMTATGIQGLVVSTGTTLFGQAGSELANFGLAIGNATVTHFALASLTSDTNGAAAFPSFTAAISTMASAIQAAAPSFSGPEWPNFCTAIATAICTEIGSSGLGTLAGSALPPPGGGVVIIA